MKLYNSEATKNRSGVPTTYYLDGSNLHITRVSWVMLGVSGLTIILTDLT